MKKPNIAELVCAGLCAAAVGTSAAISAGGGEMDISFAENSHSVICDTTESVSENDIFKNLTDTAAEKNSGISVNFTAAADRDKSSGNMLVFVWDNPPVTVYVPTEGEYDLSEALSVSGVIDSIQEYSVTLCKAQVSETVGGVSAPDRKPLVTTTSKPVTEAAVKAEVSAPAEEISSETVYVSATGKIHKKPDCSGMKSYTEMSYNQAVDCGHKECKRCY